jgi:2-polyprenyl-3-methyl-5-hydroxy-6-metoxy-1,4-benzoquinol methylase
LNKNRNYWGKKHLKYDLQGISKKPSKLILALEEYLARGDKVLEIGCGNGQDASYIAELGCNVTALDLNIDFIKDRKNKEQQG